MKAVLKFNLDDYDDERNHKLAIKSKDLYIALEDIKAVLRNQEKYDGEPLTYDRFFDILSDRSINLDEF